MDHVRSVLQPFVELEVTVQLFRGDTKNLLPKLAGALPQMDFVFIDGGHSETTVRNDWTCVQRVMGPETVVIFDDTVDPRSAQITGVGVNDVLASIDPDNFTMRRLRPVDCFLKTWGTLRIALTVVRRRRHAPQVVSPSLPFPALAAYFSGPGAMRLKIRVPITALVVMTGLLGTCVRPSPPIPASLGPRLEIPLLQTAFVVTPIFVGLSTSP